MPCLVSGMNPVLQDGQLQGEAGPQQPKDRVVSGRGSRPSCPGPTWYPGPGAGVWGCGSTCQGDPACCWGAAWRQARQLALGGHLLSFGTE